MNSGTQTWFCFCQLPERPKAKEDAFAIGSAIVVKENILSKDFEESELLSTFEETKLFSVVITNKRYRTYNTDEKENPHILLISMLLERVGYFRKEISGAFNTFLQTNRESDYALTLQRLGKEGVSEDLYGFTIDKEIFQGINVSFIDKDIPNLQKFFAAADLLNNLLKRKLQKDLEAEELSIWSAIKKRYYRSSEGSLNGYGLKIYPDEYYYRFT